MLTRWLWPSVRLMSTENGPPVLGQDHVVQSDPLVGERLIRQISVARAGLN